MIVEKFLKDLIKESSEETERLYTKEGLEDNPVFIPNFGKVIGLGSFSCAIKVDGFYQPEVKGIKNPILICTVEKEKEKMFSSILGDKVVPLNVEENLRYEKIDFLEDYREEIEDILIERGELEEEERGFDFELHYYSVEELVEILEDEEGIYFSEWTESFYSIMECFLSTYDIYAFWVEKASTINFSEKEKKEFEVFSTSLYSPKENQYEFFAYSKEDVVSAYEHLLEIAKKTPFMKELLLKTKDSIINGISTLVEEGIFSFFWDIHPGQFIKYEGENKIYCIDPVCV